jgi:hypothetical protein
VNFAGAPVDPSIEGPLAVNIEHFGPRELPRPRSLRGRSMVNLILRQPEAHSPTTS